MRKAWLVVTNTLYLLALPIAAVPWVVKQYFTHADWSDFTTHSYWAETLRQLLEGEL